MILGAHQPNYLPWIGFFHKIAQSDKFVLAENVQFSTQSYINRTRIKSADGAAHWLTVPVHSGDGNLLIKDIRIDNSKNWRKKHWKTIQLNYGKSPYFDRYAPFFESLFSKEWQFLADLNIETITYVCENYSIRTPLVSDSSLKIDAENPSDRIIQMTKITDCDAYLSGSGASKNYLDREQFSTTGIALKFTAFDHPAYAQRHGKFLQGLSVIDFLFNAADTAQKFFEIAQSHKVNSRRIDDAYRTSP